MSAPAAATPNQTLNAVILPSLGLGLLPLSLFGVLVVIDIAMNGYTDQKQEKLIGLVGIGMLIGVYARGVYRGALDEEHDRGIAALAGFGGYVAGCYLCFYEGMWSLTALAKKFSWEIAAQGLLATWVGYRVVLSVHRLGEFARAADASRSAAPSTQALHAAPSPLAIAGAPPDGSAPGDDRATRLLLDVIDRHMRLLHEYRPCKLIPISRAPASPSVLRTAIIGIAVTSERDFQLIAGLCYSYSQTARYVSDEIALDDNRYWDVMTRLAPDPLRPETVKEAAGKLLQVSAGASAGERERVRIEARALEEEFDRTLNQP